MDVATSIVLAGIGLAAIVLAVIAAVVAAAVGVAIPSSLFQSTVAVF